MTVLVAFFSFWALYDFPETADFLTAEEKAFVTHRLRYQGSKAKGGTAGAGTSSDEDDGVERVAEADEFRWEYILQALRDWQIWTNIFVYWGVVCPLYGISLFLPTIINSMGYSRSTSQLLTVPIYIVAACLAVAVAYASDRVGKRSPFIIACLVVMALGFSMCIGSGNPKVVYAGVFVAACAIYPAFPGVITWLANNLGGSYKRSAGMALQIGVGNLGGVGSDSHSRRRQMEGANSCHRPWRPTSTGPRTHPVMCSDTPWSWRSSGAASSPPWCSYSATAGSTRSARTTWPTAEGHGSRRRNFQLKEIVQSRSVIFTKKDIMSVMYMPKR